jgi:hypothetical protein
MGFRYYGEMSDVYQTIPPFIDYFLSGREERGTRVERTVRSEP